MNDRALMDKMLGLPDLTVYDFKNNDGNMVYFVEAKEEPKVCTACGVVVSGLKPYKREIQKVRDISNQGKRVQLAIRKRYYKCPEPMCGAYFAESLKSVAPQGRMTVRLRKHIADKAAYTVFADIEREYNISNTSIETIFLERVSKLPTLSQMETPRVLGIDEIHLVAPNGGRKEPWCVIANGDERTEMDMLQSRTKPAVIGALRALREPNKVEVATMDMYSGYRTAVYETLPKALVVIDKFHIVKLVTEQMDFIRKVVARTAPPGLHQHQKYFTINAEKLSRKGQQLRDMWLIEYPLLLKTYQLKESFRYLYECPTRASAERYFQDWKKSIPAGTDYNGFRMIVETIENHKREIFNYFEAPETNAFVEGMNAAIRLISSQGRGYSFEVLRGKVLLTVGRRREVVKTDFDSCTFTTFNPRIPLPKVRDYGVPFDAIIKAAQGGAYC